MKSRLSGPGRARGASPFLCARLGALLGSLMVSAAILPAVPAMGDETEASTGFASPEPMALAAYGGVWRRVPDARAESDRVSSIESAIADLSWIVRGMAGGVLKKSAVPPEQMDFSWDGERLHQLVRDRNGEFSRPVALGDEPIVLTDHRGEDFSSQWSWTESGLKINWVQEQAYGSNVYRVDPVDQSLLVEHRIHVTALSDIEPIVYRSRFSRADRPEASAIPAVSAGQPAAQAR